MDNVIRVLGAAILLFILGMLVITLVGEYLLFS
jgi:hypothetical protein